MNILIADDHAIVRKGLSQIIREEFSFAEITEAINSHEVFEKIKEKKWNIILLDISMPGRNGVEILKQLRVNDASTPILMLSMHPEEQYALRVLKAGACGYLCKESATDELITAMKKVLSGKKYITLSFAEKLIETSSDLSAESLHKKLSDRELQVLQLLAKGKPVSEIGQEISLSVHTISTYRARILEKLGLTNNAELMHYAIDNNIM
jgi:two-component system invasion response regulator UvrY